MAAVHTAQPLAGKALKLIPARAAPELATCLNLDPDLEETGEAARPSLHDYPTKEPGLRLPMKYTLARKRTLRRPLIVGQMGAVLSRMGSYWKGISISQVSLLHKFLVGLALLRDIGRNALGYGHKKETVWVDDLYDFYNLLRLRIPMYRSF